MYTPLRLKNFMEQKGVSVKKLASDLNLSEEDIILCQNDIFKADIEVLISLVDYLDVSIDYLIGNTDNPDLHKKK